MRVVPELGGDEELLALYDGGDDLLERRTDLILVLVDEGGVDVPVSVTDGVLDLTYQCEIRICDGSVIRTRDTHGVLDFLGLGEPGAEADLSDGCTGGELEDLAEGHGGWWWDGMGERGGRDRTRLDRRRAAFICLRGGSWHATPPAYDTMGRSVCGPWVVCGPRSSSSKRDAGG